MKSINYQLLQIFTLPSICEFMKKECAVCENRFLNCTTVLKDTYLSYSFIGPLHDPKIHCLVFDVDILEQLVAIYTE